jgi:hypothetical protein
MERTLQSVTMREHLNPSVCTDTAVLLIAGGQVGHLFCVPLVKVKLSL